MLAMLSTFSVLEPRDVVFGELGHSLASTPQRQPIILLLRLQPCHQFLCLSPVLGFTLWDATVCT